ncbi:MerR family transcriptional regulator [Rurimicrobium arvi]|uniref:HTH merR-type domain-containing protein n=1 Tax=Rurimicrobium arvi TaxID=2049916 RepID=A0ABP8MF34_9BACT
MEGFYQISDLARLSGVKAHTIRIWEKRYNLINPFRTGTNIRYYDDAQLKKLLNVVSLLDRGHKISAVASMSANEIKQEMLDAAPADGEFYIRELVKAMIDFDEGLFGDTLESLFTAMRPEDAIRDVVYPFLAKVGLLWRISEARPVQEHFASGLVRRRLLSMIDRLPLSGNSKTFLLFLPEGEWHELGLLVAEFLLRSYGARVINLGQSVPLDDLSFMLRKIKPQVVFTMLTADAYERFMQQLQSLVAESKGTVKLLVTGNPARTAYLESLLYCSVLKEPKEILMFI